MSTTSVATLKLVEESKIRDLLPNVETSERFEASAVLAKANEYFVAFDNRTALARITNDLRVSSSNDLIGTAPINYESWKPMQKRAICCEPKV